MKKIYRFLFAGVLALCATGCSSSLLDIENPNEVTNTTFWKSADDAKAGVNACYSFLYKEGTWIRIILSSVGCLFVTICHQMKDGVRLLG